MKPKIIFLSLIIVLLFTCFECENNVEPIDNIEPEIIWSYKLPDKIAFDDEVMPVINNGFAYIAAVRTLRCTEIENGNTKWETFLGIDINRAIRSNKLLHSGNLLFLNHTEWVKAFNKQDGSLVWETVIENYDDIDLSIMSQNENSLLLGGQGEVVKLNKMTGQIELRISLTQLMYGGNSQGAYNPIISNTDDYLYVPTGYNTGAGLKGNLLCYNSVTGDFLWGFPIQDDVGIETCAIKGNIVVFAAGSTMISLNRFTGGKFWENSINDDAFESSVIIDGETVYMGSHAQSMMYAFDLNSGKLKWRGEDTPSSIITIPTAIDNRVYFSNWAYIYVVNATNGNTLWKSLPPEYREDSSYRYMSPVAVGEGYMVCVGNKKVYCLTDPWSR
ncbi:MAG: PQQ-binding-like beta-propeller repeat protein [Ignavibacteriae bacterium]|nr:hypothetical protein [Ignavibacteriota bacterium]NOG96509.1 PQQ-binding-like beta-propeller repeat protein [Ignavibacteriota bacterium]